MGSNSGGGGSSVIDSAIFVSSRVRVSELGMKKRRERGFKDEVEAASVFGAWLTLRKRTR